MGMEEYHTVRKTQNILLHPKNQVILTNHFLQCHKHALSLSLSLSISLYLSLSLSFFLSFCLLFLLQRPSSLKRSTWTTRRSSLRFGTRRGRRGTTALRPYLYYPFLHSTVHCVHATHNGSQWWNAGMGNTDALHPNSCFFIPTSKI